MSMEDSALSLVRTEERTLVGRSRSSGQSSGHLTRISSPSTETAANYETPNPTKYDVCVFGVKCVSIYVAD